MRFVVALALLAASTPSAAEVVSATEYGFELRNSVEVPLLPNEAFQSFSRVESWWGKDHTYSGSSDNLRMMVSPGGCFCETLANGGGIEHLRVTYADPGKRVVLTGALGPLLYEAVAGVMDVTVSPVPGGSRLTMTYKAAGFASANADKLAPLVDRVLAEQLGRYRDFASPEPEQR